MMLKNQAIFFEYFLIYLNSFCTGDYQKGSRSFTLLAFKMKDVGKPRMTTIHLSIDQDFPELPSMIYF